MGGRSSTLNKFIIGYYKGGDDFIESPKAQKKLQKLFASFDKNGDGKLDKSELTRSSVYSDFKMAYNFCKMDLSVKCPDITEAEFKEVIAESDTINADGCIDFEEFKLVLQALASKLSDDKGQSDSIKSQKNAKKEAARRARLLNLIITSGGKSFSFYAEPLDSVETVKSKIFKEKGIDVRQKNFVWINNIPMTNASTIGSYNIATSNRITAK